MSRMSCLLNQVITVNPYVSEENGDATYGTAVSYPCRIEYTITRVINARGDEVSSVATVYTEANVNARDLFVLPDPPVPETTAEPMARTAIKVDKVYDHNGVFHHCEVYL